MDYLPTRKAKNGYMNKGNWLGKYVHSMDLQPLRTYLFKGAILNGLLTPIGLFISSVPHGFFRPLKKGAIRATGPCHSS